MPTTTAFYTNLPGKLGGPVSVRRNGQSRFFVPDMQGHTRQLTDSSQAVTDMLLTDAWGREVASSGSTVDPFKAFGQWGYERDAASRLYVRARHLRVDLGRWVSRDLDLFDLLASYLYSTNRPLSLYDPSGLDPKYNDKCPDNAVKTPVKQLCDALKKLNTRYELAAVDGCIRTVLEEAQIDCPTLKPIPSALPRLSIRRLECLLNFCDGNGLIYCDPSEMEIKKEVNPCCLIPPACSAAPEPQKKDQYLENGQCWVALCPKVYTEPPPGQPVPCGDTGGDTSLNRVQFAVVHEVLHCCGVKHGTITNPRPPRLPEAWQCNDVVACCILAVLFRKPGQLPKDRCKRRDV